MGEKSGEREERGKIVEGSSAQEAVEELERTTATSLRNRE